MGFVKGLITDYKSVPCHKDDTKTTLSTGMDSPKYISEGPEALQMDFWRHAVGVAQADEDKGY